MTAYISNEPYIAKRKNIDIVTFSPQYYGFEDYGDILFTSKNMIKTDPKIVKNMYDATLKGWKYAFSHIDETVELIHKKYNSLHKTKEALYYEANKLKELSGYNRNYGEINIQKIQGIAQQFNIVKQKYYKFNHLDDFIYKQKPVRNSSTPIIFSAKEIAYIKDKKNVNICLRSHQEPLVIKNKDGYSGISIDFLEVISKSTNLKFNYIYTVSMYDYFNKLKNAQCDIVSFVVTKPNKHDFLTPTIAIASDTLVLATSITEPYISDITTLKDEKIMINKDAKNLIKYVKYLYPNLNLVEVEDMDLQRVVDKEFYGLIGGSYILAHNIASNYPHKLKIITQVSDKKIQGSFGISNREPLLLNIINKSVEHITPSIKQKIINSYKSIKIEKKLDYRVAWQIFIFFIIILSIIIFYYFKQKKLTKEIEILNNSLEIKVKKEVGKNKQQQLLMLRQSRLAQMGEMIAMIAHQWRQPLNNLSLVNQLLLSKYAQGKLTDEAIAYFQKNSKKQIEQMSTTIDDFRNFFKSEKERQRFCVNDIIGKVLGMTEPIYAVDGIKISLHAKSDYYTTGYPNEFGQAVLNIINNSKDALIEKDVKDKYINISIEREEENILITISDNAGGIPENIIDKIFDPYFSTKNDKNGTGLGLYMTKIIIEDHLNAKFIVENSNDGASFKIYLKS